MDRLYYISQGADPQAHIRNITAVLEGGVSLVQLRIKGMGEAELLATAQAAKKLCEDYGACLYINDHVALAATIGAHGVHLGKQDMQVSQAKKLLPPETKVGGTANTVEDCLQLIDQGVAYIGVGPYRFTTTKASLSPVLGLEGYKKILKNLPSGHPPIYAIGGILEADIPGLLDIGLHGVAVSGLLSGREPKRISKIVAGVKGMIPV